jgi:hypothetical protein
VTRPIINKAKCFVGARRPDRPFHSSIADLPNRCSSILAMVASFVGPASSVKFACSGPLEMCFDLPVRPRTPDRYGAKQKADHAGAEEGVVELVEMIHHLLSLPFRHRRGRN